MISSVKLEIQSNVYDVEKVVCMVCNKRHFKDENTFLTFYGNVTSGIKGGLIGNNFNENLELEKVTFICRNIDCVKEALLLNEEDINEKS